MVVAVVAVLVVQPPLVEVIAVVAVRYAIVAAAVVPAGAGDRATGVRIGIADRDGVLILMLLVRGMQVAVVQVVHVIVVLDAGVAAVCAVDVGVVVVGHVLHGVRIPSVLNLIDAASLCTSS